MSQDRTALGAFLRSRRDRLTPVQAGIRAFPGGRRVPGLRREELAVLAGLSTDYYSRLEQGRQANISDGVLDALARALRLDGVEHAHLRDLAAPSSRHHGARSEAVQRPDPGLLRLMVTLDHVPVLLLGNRGDVLARNALVRSDVARWWVDHTVRDYASVPKRIQHPTAGTLSFDIEIVTAPHEPDQTLVVYTTEPDSPTARLLPILASWDVDTPVTRG